MTVRMTILAGSLKDQAFLLETQKIKIGRGPGVDFELNETSISKVHAQIEIMGDQIRIQDLGSRNGIRVGGKPVSKIRMRGGVVHIGKVPIKFEFESDVVSQPEPTPPPPSEPALPEEAEVPKVQEVKWENEDDSNDLGLPPSSSEDAPASSTAQTLAYVFLGLCLLGILAFAMRDSFITKEEKLVAYHQFTFNTNNRRSPFPLQVKLPFNYAGQRDRDYYDQHFKTKSFYGEMAGDSGKIFLVYPSMEIKEGAGSNGETIKIPLAGGKTLSLTVKIHEDNTQIPRKKVNEISEADANALYKEVNDQLSKTKLSSTPFDQQIDMWDKLKMILDSSKEHGAIYDDLLEIKALKKSIDRQFEKEREQRYRSAYIEYVKFRNNNGQNYLEAAINGIESLMKFTDEASHDYARYSAFLLHLKSNMKQFETRER